MRIPAFLLASLLAGGLRAAPPMPTPPRYFLALDVAPATQETLAVLQAELGRQAKDVRFTDPASFHVTLRFLDTLGPEVLAKLLEALGAVAAARPPLALVARGLGTFPDPGAGPARVLWAGVAGDRAALDALVADLEAVVRRAGLPAPDFPFRPHLTLARVGRRGSLRAFQVLVPRLTGSDFGPLVGDAFVLYAVGPGGDYEVVQRFPLQGESR